MSASGNQIFSLAQDVLDVASKKVSEIEEITRRTKMLAINARIEASRAGDAGRGFTVVANEVSDISSQVNTITKELKSEISVRVDRLSSTGHDIMYRMQGERLADLALNMIEIIDRNLYERSCDVRWWATDAAVVAAAAEPTRERTTHATNRLGVILKSYTVYLDLWIADGEGRVIANGRPDRYPDVVGTDVSGQAWFQRAKATGDGTEFAVDDIERSLAFGGRAVATYAAAIRRDGREDGEVIGVLGIYFDWEPQAATVVGGVRLGEEEAERSRCLLVDARNRVIASSDGKGILDEVYPLRRGAGKAGHYVDESGTLVGYSLTPGYETYRGLGWFGVIEQKL